MHVAAKHRKVARLEEILSMTAARSQARGEPPPGHVRSGSPHEAQHAIASIKQLAQERAQVRGITKEQFLEEFLADIPIGRPGDPSEVGDLAAFLCSPRNTYITGAAIPIDGGKTRRLY